MSTTEEPEATTDAVDVAADLLPTGTVEQAVAVADEVPEGGLTTDAAADLLPTGDGSSEPEAPTADEPVVEVLDEDDLFDGDGNGEPAPIRESAYDRPGSWYVVHTQSGYEKKVKQNLQARTTSMHLEDRILEVEIPMEDVDEFRSGKKVTVSKKVFPGYLLVRCHLDDEAWSVIRDTPGIVNFVGAGGKPSKLGRSEVETFLPVADESEAVVPKRSKARFGFGVGETVRVKEGPFADFSGAIVEINEDQLKVKVLVNIFGRETPVELEFAQVAQL